VTESASTLNRFFEHALGLVLDALDAQTPPGELAPLVLAIDDTILRKSGKKVPFSQWCRDPQSPPFQVNLVRDQTRHPARPSRKHRYIGRVRLDIQFHYPFNLAADATAPAGTTL
jgi:hypothetical protein